MNKDILKKVLNTSQVELYFDEIRELLDDELSKEPEEMDTELVGLCIDVLSREKEEKSTPVSLNDISSEKNCRIRKLSVKRILIAAAVICGILCVGITVSSNVFIDELPEEMVTVYDDYIQIDLSHVENTIPEEKLDDFIIEHAYIPQCFAESEYQTKVPPDIGQGRIISIDFLFPDTGLKGNISVDIYNRVKNSVKNIIIPIKAEQMKYIDIKGIKAVALSSTDARVYIFYNLNDKYYSLCFEEITLDEVVKLLNK